MPLTFNLADIEPVFHTGLQISTNPGSMTLLAGIAAATLGLIMLYLVHYRRISGAVKEDGLVIAATVYHWKVSYREEFDMLIGATTDRIARTLGGGA
jgi:hypothetical protein